MLTSQELKNIQAFGFETPNSAWLAGAKAALDLQQSRTDWKWSEFRNEIEKMVELSGITPAKPGEEPILDERHTGSAFDALGGYVSLAGDVTPSGLSFPARLHQLEKIKYLFSGLYLKWNSRTRRILIPQYDLAPFLKLVPVRGPVADWLEDFV
jgi:hypothetical protein